MDRVAVQIGQNLHFHVPRVLDVLLQIDAAVAERRLGFGPGLLQGHFQDQLVQRHAHAASAAAGRRLDQHRKADLLRQPHRGLFVGHQAIAPRHDGHLGFAGQLPGRILVPQPGHGLRRGTDEVDLAIAANLIEVRVLGKKAVTGVNRLHVADLGGADHPVDLAIAVRSLGGPHAIGFVGQFQIGGTAVRFAENRHRFDAQLSARANDA